VSSAAAKRGSSPDPSESVGTCKKVKVRMEAVEPDNADFRDEGVDISKFVQALFSYLVTRRPIASELGSYFYLLCCDRFMAEWKWMNRFYDGKLPAMIAASHGSPSGSHKERLPTRDDSDNE